MTDQPRTRQKKATSRKGKKKRLSAKKVIIILFFTAALAVVCGIIGYLFIILNGERILAANQDKLIIPEASIVYDKDKNEIASLYKPNDARENVDLSEIPELLRNAFIATEDQRFYQHSGIDYFSLGRAVVKDIVARSKVEGGSTITQQLAKNIFLTADKTFFRKATEASIAMALENNMTKDEIIEMYLNRIYFGKGVSGIKQASEYYFGVEPKDLKLWQMATLAGMPKAPNRYNPINDPEASQTRRQVVLKLMYDQGYITEEQKNEAAAEVYDPSKMLNEKANPQLYPAFVDYVIDEAVEASGISEEELRVGGYKIYTTLNPTAQQVVEKEFANDENFEKSEDDVKVQGSMIIMDHRSGEIQAIAGGRDYQKKTWNRVTKARQPGSSFKPISSYGPALETGDFTPSSTLRDDKQCFGNYCPSDSNRVKYIGAVSMKQAIKESRNLPAVWLLNQIGVSKGVDFAKRLGFNLTSDDRNLAIALGGLTNGVSPLQMATAYSVFANEGKSVDPHTVLRIDNSNEDPVYTYHAPKAKQLIKQSTAEGLTEIMSGVTEQGGTGVKARLDRPVAGKTGTTQHGIKGLQSSANRDVWFVGYTPEWTAAVWMGYDKTDEKHLLHNSSGQAAAMFGKVMTAAMKNVPRSSFTKTTPQEPEKTTDTAPAQVTGLKAQYDTVSKSVKLSWNAVEGAGLTYRVYRKESGEAEFTRVFELADNGNVEDMSAAPGLSYQYYVAAYNAEADLEGTPSAAVALDIPPEELEPTEPTEPPVEPQQPGEGTDNQGNNGSGNNGTGSNGNGSGTGTNNGNGSGTGGTGNTGTGNGNGSNNNTNQNGTPPAEGSGSTGAGTGSTPNAGAGNAGGGRPSEPATSNGSNGSNDPIVPDVVVPAP
ncbi:PBP1A family penicillin-binding protein [Paenibacillus sp. PR3]|uniref:PBP1A family penicillin-binding protein n=1 Tax=Paenibacillus terricola TaxID=2763503 RepID=A0ABR8MXM8_9BACL|nr:PBP1A family penicillin-binding protein [Paenibacillus terricola]MBD3918919.1 PBP1A family penicillin-binding protein [Paenibacillus terricola]